MRILCVLSFVTILAAHTCAATPGEIAAWQKSFPEPESGAARALQECAKDLRWWAAQTTPANAERTVSLMRERATAQLKLASDTKTRGAAGAEIAEKSKWLKTKFLRWLGTAPR